MSTTYEYPRPSVTVDIIVIDSTPEWQNILLIERKHPPFAGSYALPGGFVDKDENLIDAAYRELEEETNIKIIELKQFFTYGDKGRDPRGHTISVVYYGFVSEKKTSEKAGDDAASLKWFNVNELPALAFDHHKIITQFIEQYLNI